MLDMMISIRMDGNDIQKCLMTQYEPPSTHAAKSPRPYSQPLIWPIFGGCFWEKWKFRQHWGQQMLTKMFSSESPHETEQKTFLHFFHISLSFSCTFVWLFHVRQTPFRNNRVHIIWITSKASSQLDNRSQICILWTICLPTVTVAAWILNLTA